ncbi:MAG: DMT family transporter [Hyphomicrobiaceae bacterium]
MNEVPPWLWIVITLVAAGAQTMRNAMQRGLIGEIGTVAATHVRFLFGLPFVVLAALAVMAVTGKALPLPTGTGLAWTLFGAVSQIGGTALLLAAMRERSFVVAIAYSKLEPLMVALFGLAFLGELLTPAMALAVLVATAGVMVTGWPANAAGMLLSRRSIAFGVGSAALFAMASVGYRGAIVVMPDVGFVVRATTTLLYAIIIQTALLTIWLALRDREKLVAMAKAWRQSLLAGFLGAFASELWFLAFAIEQVARVRTLALVEILYGYVLTRRMFSEGVSAREMIGMAMVVAGVALLLNLPRPV